MNDGDYILWGILFILVVILKEFWAILVLLCVCMFYSGCWGQLVGIRKSKECKE